MMMKRAPSRALSAQRTRPACGPRMRVTVQANTVPVTVSLIKEVAFGERIKLVGNQPFLGDWDPTKAATLKWAEGHVWTSSFEVPVGAEIAFKIIRAKDDGECQWEGGDNRTFSALGPEFGLTITCDWDDTSNSKVESFKVDGSAPKEAPKQAAEPASSKDSSKNGSRSDNEKESSGGKTAVKAKSGPLTGMEGDARSTSAWVGAQPEFVRSKLEQNKKGSWNSEGLAGVELQLVEGDQKASDWLGKLGLMKTVLVDGPHKMRPGVEELAACYVYATWINTGAILCAESGGHHRPNHHANQAAQVFRSLEWTVGDAAGGEGGGSQTNIDERMLAARRLHTRLPSISGEFRQAVPLTRIRDIAHRNDIPQDLKNEIKHTLQNKLHRSAGPEDLVATEVMLARVTKTPGEFNNDFVNEFKIFTAELRDFFNASGLTELLQQVQPTLDEPHRAAVAQLLSAMSKLDQGGSGEGELDNLMMTLSMGTQARAYFASGLSAGLRNDVGDDVLAMRQRWRLAEIRIEEYMFVVLSRLVGELEKVGGAPLLAEPANLSAGSWRLAVGALLGGLRHLGLSGYATKELLALDNELGAWLSTYTSVSTTTWREAALRGKACVERVLRLTSQYSDLVMHVYGAPSQRMGDALGVPDHMTKIFGESEVRASVAFQVSRLASMMAKGLRGAANLDAWDGLVTGDVSGRLVAVETLSPETMEEGCKGHSDNVVLLVHYAGGDEELGPLGSRLAGVVLLQELPHLSHLGVRARQENVTFVTCDDDEYVSKHVKPLLGKTVRLTVASDSVTLKEGTAPAPAAAPESNGNGNGVAARVKSGAGASGRSAGAGAESMATTKRVKSLKLSSLTDATITTCGSKAARCGELERLAAGPGKGVFTTPPGAVLSFGSMELALEAAGSLTEFKAAVKELDDPKVTGQTLDAVLVKLTSALAAVRLPEQVLEQVKSTFAAGALLAVRSSANVEDLAGLSAAGLYESKVGIPVDNADQINTAVTDVWASLYSRRAVLSRRSAGVGQAEACMAVLFMELAAPEVSFVLHTARPQDSNVGVLLAELAPGQGEILASGTRGTPWRLEVDKASGKVETLAFANFSRALMVPGSTGRSSSGMRYSTFDKQFAIATDHEVVAGAGSSPVEVGGEEHAASSAAPVESKVAAVSRDAEEGKGGVAVAVKTQVAKAAVKSVQVTRAARAVGGLIETEVDYSKQRLTVDGEYRTKVGQMLAAVGVLIEGSYANDPQDIEGGLVPDGAEPKLMIFQTRPQH